MAKPVKSFAINNLTNWSSNKYPISILPRSRNLTPLLLFDTH